MRSKKSLISIALVLGVFLVQSISAQPVKKKPRTRAIPQGVVQMEIKVQDVRSRSMEPPVVESKTNEDRAQPVHDTMLTPESLVIKALDDKGRVLEKYYRKDPRLVRVEGFMSDKPGAARMVQADTNLFLDVPNRPDIATLEIYKPKWNGQSYDLTLLQTVPIPKQDVKGVSHRAMKAKATFETILKNGNSGNKVDIAIAGDGYTAAQMGKWKADAARLTTQLMQQKPFSDYKTYFNIHRIDIASQEEGAGWETPTSKQNAFGSHFNCYNTERLLCVNDTETNRIFRSVLAENQMDIKIIIANDKRYGGAGGEFATASLHDQSLEVMIHEIGHSFAGLADEYGGGERDCVNIKEPNEANVTANPNPATAKWRNFSDSGLFEGGYYCDKKYFRPYQDSKMRSLGKPFGQLHLAAFKQRIEALGSASTETNTQVTEPEPEDTPTMEPQQPVQQPVQTTTTTTTTNENTSGFKAGEIVLAKYEDGYFYPGRIIRPEGSSMRMRWLEDDREFKYSKKLLRKFNWKTGTAVQCAWDNDGQYYPARITKVDRGNVQIVWDDGEQSATMGAGYCRVME